MKSSLSKKIILLIVTIAVMISCLAVVIYDRGIHEIIDSQYESRSIDIARLVAVSIDADRLLRVQKAVRAIYEQAGNRVMSDQWGTPEFEAYVAQFSAIEEMDDYRILRADLRKMQDVLDVDCLYITWLDVENECNVYLIDAAYEDPCPVGCIDPIFTDDAEVLRNYEDGFLPNITNTPEYGWIVATGMPIRDSQGEVIAISAVDISMNGIMAQQYRFLIYTTLALLLMTILVCVVGIRLVNRFIVNPINMLSHAAAQYTGQARSSFSDLKLDRSDEIGVLADSMVHMEREIDGYITSLEKTTNDLISAREHAEQMERIANIDALTRVRNKRAYDIEVVRLNENTQPYGIVMIDLNNLKEINDTYGHEKGDVSIIRLCQIICRVFKHSPVYRIGGDEFVVLLENDDFLNRASLIGALSDAFRENAGNVSLEPWEQVTGAVGFAVYDPETDGNVDDVFKRADSEMYGHKRKMKDTVS